MGKEGDHEEAYDLDGEFEINSSEGVDRGLLYVWTSSLLYLPT